MVSVDQVFDPRQAMHADVAHLSMHCIAFMYDVGTVDTNGDTHEPNHFIIQTQRNPFFPQ